MENYHSRDKIKKREQVIMEKWRHLMDLLDKKKRVLNGYNDLLGMFREIEAIQIEMKDMEVRSSKVSCGFRIFCSLSHMCDRSFFYISYY